MMLEIFELKKLINSQSNHHSPILSDKASYPTEKDQNPGKKGPGLKLEAAKELILEDEHECVFIDPLPPLQKRWYE